MPFGGSGSAGTREPSWTARVGHSIGETGVSCANPSTVHLAWLDVAYLVRREMIRVRSPRVFEGVKADRRPCRGKGGADGGDGVVRSAATAVVVEDELW
jgi:hypothetical protein